ncbi:M4 family metallopeptidase [Nocardioides nitrophenolicus]|uniref:M4 family metallopeptidase n=1 Tax=Nocardioides nitrophenolicus TaxID=60489 RepID=UPI001958EFD2|nr:M4 family metallopeptidase [Nocardioides nitrophenolicus]MBM7520085.1 Zn-dependent metalloprotease [Nocardioides nitrophenolicus]
MRLNLPDALRKGVGLSLVGAALVVIPSTPTVATPPDPSVVQQMRDEAAGKVTVTNSPATERTSFIRATDDLFPSHRAVKSATGAAEKATAYVTKYGRAFGGAGVELSSGTVSESPAGYTVDFTQTYQGLPVFASKLRAHVDRQGDLTSVGGYVAPGIDVATTPAWDEAAAVAKAKKLVKAAPAGGRDAAKVSGDLTVSKADLSIYRMGAIQGVEGRNLLAWVIEVTDGKQVRETVVLDAATGKPVNRYSMIAHDLDRELIEAYDGDEPRETVWLEGDDWPVSRAGGELDEDQQNEVQGTGEAYWFFKNSFGRDSYDDEGSTMVTVNNDPSIQCPNANWNGISTNYCSGVSSDDTVAHEWGHAYTEYTSGLLYQWQPGAMNEAYSDIWGETVDMLNERYNEIPDVPRAVGDCSKYSLGIAISIVAPAEIAGDCVAVKASGGPDFPATPTSVTLVVGKDASDLPNDDLPTDGCSPFTNADDIEGNWVFVDENLTTGCGAGSLAEYYEGLDANAVDAGAVGIIVGGDPAYDPWDMPGATFTLPAAQVDGDSGTAIKSVDEPVTISVSKAESPGGIIDSYRWLSGEGDPAFGGAIRDMWNPNCYGDPAKVSDEEYYCDTADSGGVHTNSGVVNHTYALLVDGGTYNGVAVDGIGLDKAANIFWHTQTNYLTSTSGFAELADGLEASCAALTGVTTLKKLAVGVSDTGGREADGGALPAITASDCASVAAVADATELRVEPVQCNFKPMFKKGTIGCGDGTVTKTLWSEGFESGLPATWTKDVDAEHAHFDPTVTNKLPLVTEGGTQHKGGPSVLYFNDKGDDGNYGSCNDDDEDYSSRVSMATPTLTVPDGELPRLSFDHYVASEVEFDGGNVKVSVNGAPYALVPDGAWLYNAPGGQLETADGGNTNPMAGEAAFTGTDGGKPTGAWGSSVIDLAELAKPGDTVQFRFDFGMDGCNGIDGWYIDNVALSICTAPAAIPPGTAAVVPIATAKKGTVTIKVVGTVPTGTVTVTIKGKQYTGTVVNGVLKVKAKKQLKKLWKKGKRKVKATVSYPGDAKVAPFSQKITIKLKGKQ